MRMDTSAFIPVTLSARAVEEIKAIMQRKAIPDGYGLRVGVRGGGCDRDDPTAVGLASPEPDGRGARAGRPARDRARRDAGALDEWALSQ